MLFAPLILAGGKSTRMKSPKHLLQMPDGRPLYQHQIDILAQAFPECPTIYVSVAQDSELDGFLRERSAANSNVEHTSTRTPDVRVILDLVSSDTNESAGPTTGLLAAFVLQPQTTWLVIPCDAPFLDTRLLKQLRREYTPPVTCYRNSKGFIEPLIGIWNPDALARLAETSKGDKVGPSSIVRELEGKQIELFAGEERPLADVNTKEEWQEALNFMDMPRGMVSGGYI